jgi:hypothetical protein
MDWIGNRTGGSAWESIKILLKQNELGLCPYRNSEGLWPTDSMNDPWKPKKLHGNGNRRNGTKWSSRAVCQVRVTQYPYQVGGQFATPRQYHYKVVDSSPVNYGQYPSMTRTICSSRTEQKSANNKQTLNLKQIKLPSHAMDWHEILGRLDLSHGQALSKWSRPQTDWIMQNCRSKRWTWRTRVDLRTPNWEW